MSNSPQGEERLTIWANSNTSRGKFAAAAVHAALNWYGIDHRAVIVLGAKPKDIEESAIEVIRDAGRTEVEPGTTTAGVMSHENAPKRKTTSDSKMRAIEDDIYKRWGVGGSIPYTLSVDAVLEIVRKHI